MIYTLIMQAAQSNSKTGESMLTPPKLLIRSVVSTFLIGVSVAQAAFCPSTPSNWNAQGCDVGGVYVCQVSGTTWTCDVSGAAGTSNVYVVSNFTNNSIYEAWGDVNGTLFCCHTSDDDLENIHIIGSAYADTLAFSFGGQSYNLSDLTVNLAGLIDGGNGVDTISGSDNAAFPEVLNGDNGGDIIHGYQGDDTMTGGDGEDFMYGGAGIDYMYGGDGADEMLGSTEGDWMYGEGGADKMSGNDGNDYMNGGSGNDTMCGGDAPNGDILDDGDTDAGIDYLWGAINTDTDLCGNPSTRWDSFAGGSCGISTNYISTPPVACP